MNTPALLSVIKQLQQKKLISKKNAKQLQQLAGIADILVPFFKQTGSGTIASKAFPGREYEYIEFEEVKK